MEDVFVLAQAGELLVAALSAYFSQESKIALELAESPKFSASGEESTLPLACIALCNLEKGLEVLDGVVSYVEQCIETWKKEHGDSDRVKISSESLEAGVSAAIRTSKDGTARTMRTMAHTLCSRMTALLEAAAASGKDLSTPLSGLLDEFLSPIHDHVTRDVFKKLLSESWAGVCDRFWAAVRPDNPANSEGQGLTNQTHAAAFSTALDVLVSYFNAGGEGLSVTSLQGVPTFVCVRRNLKLFQSTTELLIGIARGLTTKPQPVLPDDPHLKDATTDEVYCILESRKAAGDRWARAWDRESAGSEESMKVRSCFALPPSELVINKWKCWLGKKVGTLYLCSRHLCFDVLLSPQASEDSHIVLMLKDITALEQTSVSLFFKGLIVRTGAPDEQPPLFSQFATAKVSEVISEIAEQASLGGNSKVTKKI